MQNNEWQSLRYDILEGDIHHITYLEISRNAVDEYMEVLEHILETTPGDSVIKMIVEVEGSDRSQPLVRVQSSLNALMKRYPERAPLRIARLNTKVNVLGKVVSVMMQSVQRSDDKLEYFVRTDVDKAIQWLNASD